MGKLTTPFILRDFHLGRYSPLNVGDFLCPENSVSDCLNVNFDTVLGSIESRGGQNFLGALVDVKTGTFHDAKVADGFGAGATIFKTPSLPLGYPRMIAAVGLKNTVPNEVNIYWDDNSQAGDSLWHKSDYDVTTTPPGNPAVRFAQLNGHLFVASYGVPMYESADGNTWTKNGNCIPDSINPSLVYRYAGRLLAAGDPNYPSRIWVSSVVDLSTSPFITWNIDPVDGDWIDVNPDDGGQITGFAEASTFLLIFKDTGMYRTDDITTGVTPDNIFNVGATSQEAITICQGVVYFYSGKDIRSTDSGYPQIISRAGIQDELNNETDLILGSDVVNVWATAGSGTCFKYSTRDQSWTIHLYSDAPPVRFAPGIFNYSSLRSGTPSPISALCSVNFAISGPDDWETYWCLMETGVTDGSYYDSNNDLVEGDKILFNVQSQVIDFGDRATYKKISDMVIGYAQNGTKLYFSVFNDDDYGPVDAVIANGLPKRVNLCDAPEQIGGHYFTFNWSGQTAAGDDKVVIEGLEIQEITDTGVNYG